MLIQGRDYMIRKLRVLFLTCSAAVLFLGMMSPASAAAQAYQYIGQWGSAGTGVGQFGTIGGIATDATGDVYVTDMADDRIQKFNSGGTVIGEWSVTGAPSSIAVNSTGDIYVATYDSDSIVRIRPGDSTPDLTVGGAGTGDAQFNTIFGLAVNASGDVYVADQDNDRIQKLDANLQYLGQWGTNGTTADGQFNGPGGVAVDLSGDVYVTDSYNERIQKFTSDGVHITTWGTLGTGNGEFETPEAIAVDETGDVYVSDTLNNRIQKFTSAGEFIVTWGDCTRSSLGECVSAGNGQFDYAVGIALNSAGRVYVADTRMDLDAERVQYFDPTTAASAVSKSFSSNTVKYKAIRNITGYVRDSQGRGIPNVPVVLKYKKADGSWVTVGSRKTTSNSGAYTFALRPGVEVPGTNAPGVNANYSVWFLGANGFPAKASGVFKIYVSPIVSMFFNRAHNYFGQTFVITAYVSPKHNGRNAYLQGYDSDTNSWVYLSGSSHTLKSYSANTSKFTDRTYVDFRDKAQYKIRVVVPSHTDHAAGISSPKWVYFNK